MALRLSQLEEVVAVAGRQETIVLGSKCENRGVGGLEFQDIAEPEDFVVQFSEQVSEIVGYVLIEQELHC